jgi:NADH-quinone oxidoreductase subunit D
MRESTKICLQCLDALEAMKGEPFEAKVPRTIKPPEGEVYSRIESPRGELGCYLVSDGSDTPVRMHWRAPSFANLQALPTMARGGLVADMVAVLGSIDIVLGDVDR